MSLLTKIHFHPNDFPDYLNNNHQQKRVYLFDENTYQYVYPKLQALTGKSDFAAHSIILPAGEEHKDLQHLSLIWEKLQEFHADRNTELICVGGGVISDLGALAASTYMRGIPLMILPTTLLAMCDASIGGKTGINFNGPKNNIGSFYPASHIFILPEVLDTLPEREMLSGMAEMIKHSLLISKEDFFHITEMRPREIISQLPMIQKSVTFKSNIVNQDPKELGLRKILNLGHTIGHGIEAFCLKKDLEITHGEAVAAGIIIENKIAVQMGLLATKIENEIQERIDHHYPRIKLTDQDIPSICEFMAFDKKNADGEIKAVLLENYGQAKIHVGINQNQIRHAMKLYIYG